MSKNTNTVQINRRSFTKMAGGTVVATGALSFFHFGLQPSLARQKTQPLQNWDDLYRQKWTWDKIAKGSHGWLNCRSSCNWNIYVKDGIVVREEQAANYEASEEGVPDFNPRGCQKGACYSEVMYGPSRLTVPLKRKGERGSGQWEQISWDQALSEIAETMLDVAEKEGTEAVVHDLGPHFDQGATTMARTRFFQHFGAAVPDDWAEIGDLNLGASLTFGFPHIGGSSDEWFLSDYLVVWMMNPSVTQMADAHFLYEARYNGADIAVISPEYSATAVHADLWLPIKPGTDTALALAVARHIFATNSINMPYVQEQTDLPMLVRMDTGRFLREADLEEGGKENQFYFWDKKSQKPVLAPGCEGSWNTHLAHELDPPIDGAYSVVLPDGKKVMLAPVGALIKEELAPWTCERTAEVTGLGQGMVRKFAEDFAKAKRPMVLSSWGSNRYLHSDLMNRAKILCLSLKGAIGLKGAGFHSTGWVGLEGFEAGAEIERAGLIGFAKSMVEPKRIFSDLLDLVARRKTMADLTREVAHEKIIDGMCMTNSASLNYVHQGIAEDISKEMDHLYPQPFADYEKEATEKDWMPTHPRRHITPRVWITGGNNVLRRSNLPQRTFEHMWPKLELVVDVNPKLTFTGMHADILLPAAGYYEKPGIKYPVAYVPYLQYCDAAVEPIGQSKDEWEIYSLLAQKIEALAKKRNMPEISPCGFDKKVDFKSFYQWFSCQGDFTAQDAEAVTQNILDSSSSTFGMEIEDLKKTGIQKYTSAGSTMVQSQIYNEDWDGEGVLQALTHFVKDKFRWPTLTGRQQFYIDHRWFIEAGEALPAHKESPKAGGDHKFQFISCHSRWSVHSIWRDTTMLQRLQRGEPVVYLNSEEAIKLGLKDGDWAELSNDYGAMRMRCKFSTMVRPRVAYYFHAWEPYQFPDHKSYKWLIPGLINPLHMAGGEGHLGWRFAMFEPGQHVQDTRVDVQPWRGEDQPQSKDKTGQKK